MRGFALVFSAAATLCGGLVLFGWPAPWQRAVGPVLLALFLLGVVWCRLRRGWFRSSATESDPAPSFLRPIAFGLLLGVLALAWLGLGFAVLGRWSWLNATVLDSDRAEVERRVDTLTTAGNWEAAAGLLKTRLGAPASSEWRAGMGTALYDCLVESARTTPAADRRLVILEEAVGVARSSGCDGRLAEQMAAATRPEADLLRRMEECRTGGRFNEMIRTARVLLAAAPTEPDRLRIEGWLLDGVVGRAMETEDLDERIDLLGESVRLADELSRDSVASARLLSIARTARSGRDHLAAEIEQLREDRDWAGLAARTRAALADPPPPAWGLCFPETLVEALSESAAEAPDSDTSIAFLTEAIAAAKRYGLSRADLDRRLQAASDLQAAMRREAEERRTAAARLRPRALPPGSTGGVLAVDTSLFPPVVAIEVWVEDPVGQAVTGLLAKDFRIHLAGEPAKCLAVAPVAAATSGAQVVLALDVSDSMAGRPLTEMLAGARALAGALPERGTSVSVLAFSGTVRELCPWTADVAAVDAAIAKPISAGGGTALLDVVLAGAEALSARPGRRQLVLFTDGARTTGNSDLPAAIERCRAAGVSVHAIGLRSRSLDEETLRRLARETDGSYVVAESAPEIGAAFHGVSHQVRKSFYRVVVRATSDSGPVGSPVVVTVGGEGAVTLRGGLPVLD